MLYILGNTKIHEGIVCVEAQQLHVSVHDSYGKSFLFYLTQPDRSGILCLSRIHKNELDLIYKNNSPKTIDTLFRGLLGTAIEEKCKRKRKLSLFIRRRNPIVRYICGHLPIVLFTYRLEGRLFSLYICEILLKLADKLILLFPTDASAEVNAIIIEISICRLIIYYGCSCYCSCRYYYYH